MLEYTKRNFLYLANIRIIVLHSLDSINTIESFLPTNLWLDTTGNKEKDEEIFFLPTDLQYILNMKDRVLNTFLR